MQVQGPPVGTGRHVVPTPTGWVLFELAHAMLAAEASARGYLEGSAALRHGHLALGSDGPHCALDLLGPFMRRHPGIEITLRMGNAETTQEALLKGQVDAAVTASLQAGDRIATVPIRRSDMLAAGRPRSSTSVDDQKSDWVFR